MPPTNAFADNVLNLRILLGKIGAPALRPLIRPADSSQSEGRRLCVQQRHLYHVQDRHADPEQAASNRVEIWRYAFKIGGQQQFPCPWSAS